MKITEAEGLGVVDSCAYEEIVKCNLKRPAPFMSSQIIINLCQFMGITIYIGVYWVFPYFGKSEVNGVKGVNGWEEGGTIIRLNYFKAIKYILLLAKC